MLNAVLRLAVKSSGGRVEDVARLRQGLVPFQDSNVPPSQRVSFSALQSVIIFVFSTTELFIDAVPEAWRPIFVGTSQPNFSSFIFVDRSHRRMWYGIVVLMARLGKSALYHFCIRWLTDIAASSDRTCFDTSARTSMGP